MSKYNAIIKTMLCFFSCCLLSLLVTSAQAELAVGDAISFGRWHQNSNAQDNTPIQWRVLDIQGDNALLISDKALDSRPYDLYRVDVPWDQCTLRAWMNTELLSEAFTPDEQKAILVTTVNNGTECPPTEDKLFLLNYSEGIRYLSNDELVAHYTRYAAQKDGLSDIAFSWTRESNRMINMHGTACSDLFLMGNLGVRPAMWVSISAMKAPESAPTQDFVPPVVIAPQRAARKTTEEGITYRCLLLRGPQWSGRNAQYGYMLTELMPDETIFYPEVGFPETSGPDARAQLDKMAQLADDDDVTYILVAAHGVPNCYDFYRTTDYFSAKAYISDVLSKVTFAKKLAAIRGQVIVLSLSCYSGTLTDYCKQLDPSRYTIWMSCGNEDYSIGSTEEMLYHACTAVQNDESGIIELGEISAFNLSTEDATPCVYGNPENYVFPVKNE